MLLTAGSPLQLSAQTNAGSQAATGNVAKQASSGESNATHLSDAAGGKMLFDRVVAVFAALASITIAIAAIWGNWIRSVLAPAKLSIELHDPEGDLTRFSDAQTGKPLPPPNRVYYYHLKVVNKRRWYSPQNCCVLLKAINKRGPDGKFHPIRLPVPLQFVWAPAELAPRMVPVQKEQIFDFGRITEADPRFVPVLYSYSNNFEGFVGPNEAVRYSLEIVSDGYVSHKTQEFEVVSAGIGAGTVCRCRTISRYAKFRSSGGTKADRVAGGGVAAAVRRAGSEVAPDPHPRRKPPRRFFGKDERGRMKPGLRSVFSSLLFRPS